MGATQRQGLLDVANRWRQSVGARRMLHRYVGTHLPSHDDLPSALLTCPRNGAHALCWTTHERRSVCLFPNETHLTCWWAILDKVILVDSSDSGNTRPDLPSWHSAPHTALLCMLCAGHANVQTDIKEAIFMGSHDDLVAAGSDDGSVFIYDAVTGQVVNILHADEDVANCVQVRLLHNAFL